MIHDVFEPPGNEPLVQMSIPRANRVGADNPYRIAIDDTVRLLEQRARVYRDLVVAVSLVGLTMFGWALLSLSLRPLGLLALLALLCLGFVWHDRRLLNGWRARLLADWTAGAIDFAALRGALLANPTLPKNTLAAMLDSLPDGGDPSHERAIALKTRKAVALAVAGSDRQHTAGLALAGLAAAMGAVGCVLSVLLAIWWPLICVLLAVAIWATGVRNPLRQRARRFISNRGARP
jgi:hypothetical protein